MKHPPVVSIEEFTVEILEDLPRLFKGHPKGVAIHTLHTEYGESTQRILRAITILEERELIRVYKSSNNSSYILPLNAGPPDELGSLSDLQRRTCQYLRKLCEDNHTNKVRTNYAQLARILESSATGIRNCIERLSKLEYLTILNPSSHGKQSDLLLQVTDKLLHPKNPLD